MKNEDVLAEEPGMPNVSRQLQCEIPSRYHEVALIKVPFGLAGARNGAEFGPDELVTAGLKREIASLGYVLSSEVRIDCPTQPVIAGEHSLTGNLHGMSVAASLGHAVFNLSQVKGAGSFINPSNLVYVGLRDLDDYEKKQIRALGIRAFTMQDIDRMGMRHVIEQAMVIAGGGTDGIHVSFDMDCLDPREAPGVGTPVPGGLSYREAHFAMECLAACNQVVSMELVEVNPLLDQNRHTARLGVGLIASLLGKSIL